MSDDLIDLLSDSERTRIYGFVSEARQHEFMASRWLIRCALDIYFADNEAEPTKHDPLVASWQLLSEPKKPPQVLNAPTETHIGLSHSEGAIAVSISRIKLGIDLQKHRSLAYNTVCERLFHTEAVEHIRNSTNPQRAFFQRWTEKEAAYKWLSQHQQTPLLLSKTLTQQTPSCWHRQGKDFSLAVCGLGTEKPLLRVGLHKPRLIK